MATTTDVPRSFQTFSPLRLLTPLLARWRRLALWAVIGAVFGVAIALVLPKRYTATVRFTAEGSPGGPAVGSGVAALARQFGFSVDIAATLTGSPLFYTDLIYTREILEPLLAPRYPLRNSADSVDLFTLLTIRGRSRRDSLDKGMRRLRGTIRVDLTRSGLVTVHVTMPDPQIAAGVANRLLERLNAFRVEQLQFQSRQQRQFAELRQEAAQEELENAEQAEAAFLEGNRLFEQSPILRARYAQLQRATRIKQEIALTLARAFEEARLQEARDVPALTIVESAVAPARKSWPPRRPIAVGGMMFGLAVGVMTIWLQWWLREARQERHPGVVELTEAWETAFRPRR